MSELQLLDSQAEDSMRDIPVRSATPSPLPRTVIVVVSVLRKFTQYALDTVAVSKVILSVMVDDFCPEVMASLNVDLKASINRPRMDVSEVQLLASQEVNPSFVTAVRSRIPRLDPVKVMLVRD